MFQPLFNPYISAIVSTLVIMFQPLFYPCYYVSAIVLLGEPKHWESSLQVLVDILKTNGKPDRAPHSIPHPHIPVVACNMDLQFMDRACMPR